MKKKKTMQTSTRNIAPDGGWGWVVVAASFSLMFLVFGTMYSLSVLYVSWLEEFESGKGTTSWIVSVAMGLAFCLAPLPAGVARRFGYRVVTLTGAFLCSIGFFLSYFATSVYFLMITIGVISGIGASFCYLPAVAMVGLYFCKRRAVAIGLSMSGVAVGVFLMPPFINWLIQVYQWRGCMLLLSAFILNGVVCGSVMRPVEGSSHTGYKTEDEGCQPILVSEEKIDLGKQNESAAHEAVIIHEEKTNEGKASPYDARPEAIGEKQSCETNLITDKCVLNEVENKISESENSISKSMLLKTYLHKKHLGNEGHVGGSLKALATLQDLPVGVRKFSSEREINNSKKNGMSTNLITSRTHHLNISVGSSFHSLLFADREIDSLLSVYSDRPDKTDEHEEEDTTTTKWCSHLTRAFKPYFQLLRSGVFLLYSTSNCLTNLSYMMPVLYMVDRAVESNIDKTSAAILLSIYGVGGLFGRIAMGLIADSPCMDKLVCYITSLMICGVSTCLSSACGDSLPLHGIYAFIYGGTAGGYANLAAVVTAELVDVQYIGIAYSIVLSFMGPATMIGSPLAGWIVDVTGSYNLSFIINGICLSVSALMLLPVLWIRRRNTQTMQLDIM